MCVRERERVESGEVEKEIEKESWKVEEEREKKR